MESEMVSGRKRVLVHVRQALGAIRCAQRTAHEERCTEACAEELEGAVKALEELMAAVEFELSG